MNICFDYNQETQDCSVSFRSKSRQPMTWQDEIFNTANYIRNSTDKEIIIASSGGIDSEIACLAFLKQNIQFTVLTVQYPNSLNEHDISYAKKFCKENNLKHVIVELEPMYFYTEGIQKYIDAGYKAHNIFRYLQLFLLETIDQMGSCAVLGGGEQIYSVQNNEVGINFPYDFFNPLTWVKNSGNLHFPYFYYSTPEQALSYLKEPLVQSVINNPQYLEKKLIELGDKDALTPFALKTLISYNKFPSSVFRLKYNGFESLIPLRREASIRLGKMFTINGTFIPVTKMIDDLEGH